MPDIDDVINGLKKVWNGLNAMEHELYADYVFDALEVLQNHKNDIPQKIAYDDDGYTCCGNCGYYLNIKYVNCPKCGRRVDWDA